MAGPKQRGRVRKREVLSLVSLLPNMVTILGLCAGLTAIRFVLTERYDIAAALLIFAAAIDGLDGLLARRLNAASDIGGELDSLSDFLNFGVAPAILVFEFALRRDFATGWMFVLIYACCCCLRLARFNVSRDVPLPAGATPFFVGVPAPGGAMLALLPLFMTYMGLFDVRHWPLSYGLWMAVVAWAMVSRIPTLSSKSLRISREYSALVLIGAAVVVGLMVTRFWLLMSLLTFVYGAVIAWAMISYVRKRERSKGLERAEATSDEADQDLP